MASQAAATGFDCGVNQGDCIQSDGSGYYVSSVPNYQSHCPHIWNPKFTPGPCTGGNLGARWTTTASKWGMSACLGWLAKAARTTRANVATSSINFRTTTINSRITTKSEYNTCIDTSCLAGKDGAKILPAGFGANAEKDIASIKRSGELATFVNCVCTKCGRFDELKSLPAYKKGGCKVAAEHMGLSQYPS